VKRAVVVGAGVLGVWHALELCRHGYAVQHLEADPRPTGASVRNFGLIWVSGRRSGEELDVARRARARWEEVAADTPGLGFRANGSLTVAMTDGERKVMEEFASHPDALRREITFVEPHEIRDLNPALAGDVLGGLHCVLDAAVEPRLATDALRGRLLAHDDYQFHPGRRVVEAAPQGVIDSTGVRWQADLVIIATGAAFDHLPGTEHLAVAAAHHLQLLLVQRNDGGLTIGDTHAYGEPFDFDLDEEPTVELLQRAERILGTPLPAVRRRWEGVYAQCTDGAVCAREEIQPGVFMVTGPGGRGMTCAPAIAADTLALAGVSATSPASS
jgi:glycine/D-amino acid oxidase-like deaminating enzyme